MLLNVYYLQREEVSYDATTTAAASDITLSGLQGGETLTLGGSGPSLQLMWVLVKL